MPGTALATWRGPKLAKWFTTRCSYFEGERYELVAACVMPNHVHAVFAPLHGHGLADILHSWKSFTSKEANKLLGTTGQFWEREYFDRLIRNAAELERTVRYVVENPVKAGLKDWRWVWVRDAGFRNAAVPAAPGAGRMPALRLSAFATFGAKPSDSSCSKPARRMGRRCTRTDPAA